MQDAEKAAHRSRDVVIASTATSAGKNLLSCGLLRLAKRRGAGFKPFKPLEIDNFSPVETPLQPGIYLQARAAGVTVEGAMNPIRVVYEWGETRRPPELYVCGECRGDKFHEAFHPPAARRQIEDAIRKLKSDGGRLLIEVPGGFCESQSAPAIEAVLETLQPDIILIGSFLRGGGLASLVGTLELMSEELRRRVIGVVLNHLDLTEGEELPRRAREELKARYAVDVVGILPTWTEGFNTISEDNQEMPDLGVFDAQVDRLSDELESRFAPEFIRQLCDQ